MDNDALKSLLQKLSRGEISVDAAEQECAALFEGNIVDSAAIDLNDEARTLGYEELGFAKIDVDRVRRTGIPEAIYGAGKSFEQIVGIIDASNKRESGVLMTRLSDETLQKLSIRYPLAEVYSDAHCLLIRGSEVKEVAPSNGTQPLSRAPVAIVTAGTSDHSVAMETKLTLSCLGIESQNYSDVGVAGIHRLFANLSKIREAQVVIVIAGMDGALPSVVAGLVSAPVIAVPTSVGYGASFGGIAALLTMLNSCASGVTVCNIDNGYGAAIAAFKILGVNRSESDC